MLYATPWNTRDGWKTFRENFFGIYSWIIGTALSIDVRDKILPKIKDMLSEEDYLAYKRGLENNRKGLVGLDEEVYVRMYGYKDVWHYYDYVTVSDQVTKIKVPTFTLGACDDQIVDDWAVTPRKQACDPNSNVCVAMTDFGAHCCHLTGKFLPESWYPYPCMEFFEFLESRKQLSSIREGKSAIS